MARKHLTMVAALIIMGAMQLMAGHVMIDGELTDSQIYPGTVHTFQVSVPDGYDGSRPAALFVGLDGVLCRAPQVIDSLMAGGKMPVTIGVYLQPGLVKAGDGTVLRYNRSYEFDSTTGDFAAFLETELIPAVEQMTTPGGVSISLSSLPRDRMICGLSSGGIAAFNAAWHRPDLFGKVFTGVGTFVAMRGGNDLQALVRKTEPLPLRVFIQDGTNDAWNPLFGHWYEGNRLLASALEFAGYDLRCDWSDGGHNVVRATQVFPEAMEWMWQDRLFAITTQNDFLQDLLADDDAGWCRSEAASCLINEDSVIAVYPDGAHMAMANHTMGNVVWQYILANGEPTHGEPFYWLHNDDNSRPPVVSAMQFDGKGNLWVVTRMGIQVCDQNGRVRAIVRLPHDIGQVVNITISDGMVTLRTTNAVWQRRFNVKQPVKGIRPTSQGQG